jgi:hypothetical protein
VTLVSEEKASQKREVQITLDYLWDAATRTKRVKIMTRYEWMEWFYLAVVLL